MKTILFTSTYLDGKDRLGNDRLERTIQWLKYHWAIKDELGFDEIVMCDNGSSISSLTHLHNVCQTLDPLPDWHPYATAQIMIMKMTPHLPTGSGLDYPYCWRALYYQRDLMRNGQIGKIVFIDNDAYILSLKMANHIRSLSTGWVTPWCPRWGFAESSISVICRDSFHLMDEFCVGDYLYHNGKMMEVVVPYSNVNALRGFTGDRYGEDDPVPPQNEKMDFYCQKPLSVPVIFNRLRA